MHEYLEIDDIHTEQNELDAVWHALCTPILRVLDPEDGNKPEEGRIRAMNSSYAIYVDDVDGYQILRRHDCKSWTLALEEEEA